MDDYNALSDQELADEIRRVWDESLHALLIEADRRNIELAMRYEPADRVHVVYGGPVEIGSARYDLEFTKTTTL